MASKTIWPTTCASRHAAARDVPAMSADRARRAAVGERVSQDRWLQRDAKDGAADVTVGVVVCEKGG